MLWKCFSGLLLRVYNGTQQTGVPKFNSPSQNPLTVYFSSPSVHSQKNLHSHVRQLSQTGYVPHPSSRAHQLTLITLEVSAPLLAPLVSLPTCCRQAMNDALKHLPRLLFCSPGILHHPRSCAQDQRRSRSCPRYRRRWLRPLREYVLSLVSLKNREEGKGLKGIWVGHSG